MLWMISPAVATAIARQQTVDEVRESRRRRAAARLTPEPDTERQGRHKARRRSRAFWFLHLRKRLAH